MSELLFNTPWWLPTAFIGIGLAVYWTGNNRQEKPVMRFGIAAMLLGVLLALVSYLVETDIEKVLRRTNELVAAVNKRDWATFSSLLDPKTSFYDYHNREQIVRGAQETADKIGLKSVRITGREVEKHDTLIVVNIRVLSEQDAWPSGAIPSDWQLQWQDFGNGWVLYRVQALNGQQVNEERVRRVLAP